MTIEQIIRGIAEKWLLEAEARCPHCKMKWDLGRHGCHYEPLPEGESPEGFDGISLNCMAFGIRRRILELLAALPDILAAERAARLEEAETIRTNWNVDESIRSFQVWIDAHIAALRAGKEPQ